MLTVKEINEVSFGKAGFSGYRPDDVDRFIDEVADSFTQLEGQRDDAVSRLKELTAKNAELSSKNAELQEKLSVLAKQVEGYRQDEDGIKDALLSAQRLAKTSVQEAKDKAEIMLQDARESARQILDKARVEAAMASQEYADQTEAKREELEEMKRQVSAFRSSLLEMYKKHLEQINHIPNFRVKEPAPAASTPAAPEEAPADPDPAPVQEPVPAPAKEEAPAVREESVKDADSAPAPEKTLQDKVDFSQGEEPAYDDDLTDMGIDLKSYSSIPESLRREKDAHFSNLEFGDDVDLRHKKKKK